MACATWLPDSRSVLVHARPDPAHEPDWWIVPIEGGSPTNTGLITRLFREARLFTIPTGVAWVADSLVFSAGGPQGVCLYRQRMTPTTFQPAGAPEQLTAGSDSAWLPSAASGRWLPTRRFNLWSAHSSGSRHRAGPLRDDTRPGSSGYLSMHATSYACLVSAWTRRRISRDLQAGVEKRLEGPEGEKGVSGDLAKRNIWRMA